MLVTLLSAALGTSKISLVSPRPAADAKLMHPSSSSSRSAGDKVVVATDVRAMMKTMRRRGRRRGGTVG
jgi:hypothetical protein